MSKIIRPGDLKNATPDDVRKAMMHQAAMMPVNADGMLIDAMRLTIKLLTGRINAGRIPGVPLVVQLHAVTGQAMTNIIMTAIQDAKENDDRQKTQERDRGHDRTSDADGAGI